MDYDTRLNSILRKPENRICADCNSRNPRWISLSLGVFICIRCCGLHRGLGTHISKVKSCSLDRWTEDMFVVMEALNNSISNAYWEYSMPPDTNKPEETTPSHSVEMFIRDKYAYRIWAPRDEFTPVERVKRGEGLTRAIATQPPMKTTQAVTVDLLDNEEPIVENPTENWVATWPHTPPTTDQSPPQTDDRAQKINQVMAMYQYYTPSSQRTTFQPLGALAAQQFLRGLKTDHQHWSHF